VVSIHRQPIRPEEEAQHLTIVPQFLTDLATLPVDALLDAFNRRTGNDGSTSSSS
jgi:hypothetical protein